MNIRVSSLLHAPRMAQVRLQALTPTDTTTESKRLGEKSPNF